jgi:hypothetical protein
MKLISKLPGGGYHPASGLQIPPAGETFEVDDARGVAACVGTVAGPADAAAGDLLAAHLTAGADAADEAARAAAERARDLKALAAAGQGEATAIEVVAAVKAADDALAIAKRSRDAARSAEAAARGLKGSGGVKEKRPTGEVAASAAGKGD